MFLKMLKSDLRQKRGLNVVLFLFITVASVLVCVGSVQMFQSMTQNERNSEACKISDMFLFTKNFGSNKAKEQKEIEKVLKKNSDIKDFYSAEVCNLDTAQVDFDMIDESKVDEMRYASHFLITVPKGKDLLFDLDNQPFYVPNGKVYLSEKMRSTAFVDVGDKVKFTTDTGNIYELEIAGFYKQPYMGGFKWYVVSDADYKLLTDEIFTTSTQYGIELKEKSYFIQDQIMKDLIGTTYIIDTSLQYEDGSNDYILGFILMAFLAIISLFMILIIVMTIRFTMMAAMKEEEREIGTMRALGVDSFGFRWMFAAKYIAFAVIGGILGIAVGVPLSRLVLNIFGASNIQPDSGIIIGIGIAAVLFIIALMIAFSLVVMRRINKISVIEAIRGTGSSERVGKSGIMYLHKRKHMSPSFYLAFSDILKRFKRYVFLFIAYTLAAAIILLVVNIKNSVINTEFLKYSLIYQCDFFLQFRDDQINDILDQANKENKGLWTVVNEKIKKAGIPARIDADHNMTSGLLEPKGRKINTTIFFGKGDISRLSYCEGGTIPQKKDEIAFSSISARNLGIEPGDEVTINVMHEDPETHEAVGKNEKFRVTALINMTDGGDLTAIVGPEYKNSTQNGAFFATIIDAEGDEKEAAFKQLQELFGPDVVLSGDMYLKMILAEYDELFTLLEFVIGGVLLVIIMLMTYLYSSVFIAEEKSETALLKSVGFTDGAIKEAHMFRILILSVISVILGEVLLKTAGSALLAAVMENLGISGFVFVPEYLMSFAVVPLIVIGTVLLTQWLNLKKLTKTAVWNIADE